MPVSLGQHAINHTNSGTSVTTTITATTVGSLIILVIAIFNSTLLATALTDSAGQSYAEIGTEILTGGNGRIRVFYRWNSASITNAVAKLAASAFITLNVIEVKGADLLTPIDQNAQASGTAANQTVGPIVTTSDGQFILVAETRDDFTQPTLGGGYSLIDFDNAASVGQPLWTEFQIQSAAGSISGTSSTPANTDAWAMKMASFEVAVVQANTSVVVRHPN